MVPIHSRAPADANDNVLLLLLAAAAPQAAQ
jgi:hypothetical protein